MEYVSKVTSIITDLQGWILLLVGAITTLRIAKEGVAYQQPYIWVEEYLL